MTLRKISKLALTLIAWINISILLIFILRRWLFILFALLPSRPGQTTGQTTVDWPQVLLLVPIRNETEVLPGLLQTLTELDYPADRYTGVLIDDGSTDGSGRLIQAWVRERAQWHALRLEQNRGKAQALNIAVQRYPQGEVIAIYDADERPTPAALRHLVAPFSQAGVGGSSGRRAVSNALTSPAASYTAFEGLVHQLVTMRAKDRLNLAPALLGANCAYRRTALHEVGGFRPEALLEDSDLTLKLAQAGWQVRFVPISISYHHVPETIAGYWRQHTRWARGFNNVAQEQGGHLLRDQQLPWLLRLELLIFSLGYLDRVAFLLGAGLMVIHGSMRRLLGGIMLLNLLTPLLQIVAALKIGRERPTMWGRIVWVPLFFGVDLAMASTGLWGTMMKIPQVWEERRVRK